MAYILNMTPDDLKAWRTKSGYSQSQLAKVLGVATMTVSRWETGLREIPSFLHLALECLKAKGGELRAAMETVRIYANVAPATHGETTKEVLGSGNGRARKKKMKGGVHGKGKRNL